MHSFLPRIGPVFWSQAIRIFCLIVGMVMMGGESSITWAHGVLIESSPPHGAVLESSPSTISLRFNAALEPAVTKVTLVDLEKHAQELKISDASTVERIIASVPPLSPGVYFIRYQVLATDGHVTEGSIRFTILAR